MRVEVQETGEERKSVEFVQRKWQRTITESCVNYVKAGHIVSVLENTGAG